jgi:hypothetical protein
MSTASRELPRATAWAVALAAIAGLAPLAVTRPVLGAGLLAGGAVGVSVRGLGRSARWTTLATAALPLGAFGVVVTVWLPQSVETSLLTLVAVVVGISLVGLLMGGLTAQQSRLVVASAAVNVVTLVLAGSLTAEAQSGGLDTAVQQWVWLGDGSAAGLAVWLFAAAGAGSLALAVAPPSIVASLRGQPLEFRWRRGSPVVILLAAAALVAVLGGGMLLPVVSSVLDPVAASGVVRWPLVGVTLAALLAAGLVALARGLWSVDRAPFVIPVGAGGIVGAVAVGALATTASAEFGRSLGAVFTPTILGIVAVGATTGWLARAFSFEGIEMQTHRNRHRFGRRRSISGPGRSDLPLPSLSLPGREQLRPDTLIPAGLVGGAIVVAVGMDGTPALDQVGVLVAIASAIFVHGAFARGRAAAKSVGVENVSRLPQAIWLGWTAALAAAGLVVGVVGLVLSDLLVVSLSVPATAGVAFALVALVAGIWLLLR